MITKDIIKDYINLVVTIDDNDWLILSEHISIKQIQKDELLLKENQICDFIAFIGKGTLIYYKTLENGDDVTQTLLSRKNGWQIIIAD